MNMLNTIALYTSNGEDSKFYALLSVCVCVCVCVCVHAQSWSTLCNTIDWGPPGPWVHRTSQANILEWVSISYSKVFSQSRNWTCFSCIGRQMLYHCTTWATLSYALSLFKNKAPYLVLTYPVICEFANFPLFFNNSIYCWTSPVMFSC